jgi:hypothetical protein
LGKKKKPIKRWNRLFEKLLTGRSRLVLQSSVFIAGFFCCGAYSVRLGAFNTWDFLNYQYYAPYALLHGRFDFDYAAAQIQTFLNPLPFVPFYAMAAHLKPVVTGFVMGGIHGLAAGLLFLTALTLFSSLAPPARILLGLSCAALGVYGPTFLGMLGGSGNDNLLSLFVLAAVYAMILGITRHGAPDERAARRTLLVAGGLLGIAAGLKLVCAIFLLGCGIAVFAAGSRWRSRLTATGLLGCAGILGILLSRGYWMVFLWSKFGSPLFPFYNSIFRSPYYYNTNFADTRFIPDTLSRAVFLPFQFMTRNHFTEISHQFRDIRYALVYALIVILLIVLLGNTARRRPLPAHRPLGRAGAFLLVFFATSYVIWQMKFAIMRYIVPLELLAPIVIAVIILSIVPRDSLRAAAIVLAFAAVAAVMKPRDVPRQKWSAAYVRVDAPKFPDPRNTLVVLANNEPWAYVIPFFQPEVRFVGLCNNFNRQNPGDRHRAADEALTIIKTHRGPMYLLSNPLKVDMATECLQACDIVRAPDSCLVVVSKQERTPLCLWPIDTR